MSAALQSPPAVLPTAVVTAVCWRASPIIDALVESQQRRDLDFVVNGHVILDSVQCPQHQVEHADGIPQGVGQLLNDNGKTAATGCTAAQQQQRR